MMMMMIVIVMTMEATTRMMWRVRNSLLSCVAVFAVVGRTSKRYLR